MLPWKLLTFLKLRHFTDNEIGSYFSIEVDNREANYSDILVSLGLKNTHLLLLLCHIQMPCTDALSTFTQRKMTKYCNFESTYKPSRDSTQW